MTGLSIAARGGGIPDGGAVVGLRARTNVHS